MRDKQNKKYGKGKNVKLVYLFHDNPFQLVQAWYANIQQEKQSELTSPDGFTTKHGLNIDYCYNGDNWIRWCP